MIDTMEGRIIKALSGFYYVETTQGLITCKARGLFRKNEQSPYVGDNVSIQMDPDGTGSVMEIFDRKNFFIRPPIANLDILAIVVSTCEPSPNTLITDKLITVAEYKGIEPVLLFTKMDLEYSLELVEVYQRAGFQVFIIEDQFDALLQYLAGKITALVGNSGVGKSTLLNRLNPKLNLPTGDISTKLGRGRHTTRHVELHAFKGSGYIADTPGFSTMDITRYDVIEKEQLQYCFREFEQYLGNCKFTSCSHTVEKGCAVLEALAINKIEKSRHNSYKSLYEDAQKLNSWE